MPDICDLVLDDHEVLRRRFAELDEGRDGPAETLAALWQPLAELLELHAATEEAVFYPCLLQVGLKAKEETEDAITDHNRIRDAIGQAEDEVPGSRGWWGAVDKARQDNSDHMAEEERGAIADLRRHTAKGWRAQVGARWVAFKSEHAGMAGLQPEDKDPAAYMEHPE